MRKTVMEHMDDAIKDLRKIRDSLYRAARKCGYNSAGFEYENAIGDIGFAIDNIKESKTYVRRAEKEKKKCKY